MSAIERERLNLLEKIYTEIHEQKLRNEIDLAFYTKLLKRSDNSPEEEQEFGFKAKNNYRWLELKKELLQTISEMINETRGGVKK